MTRTTQLGEQPIIITDGISPCFGGGRAYIRPDMDDRDMVFGSDNPSYTVDEARRLVGDGLAVVRRTILRKALDDLEDYASGLMERLTRSSGTPPSARRWHGKFPEPPHREIELRAPAPVPT